MRYFYDKEGIRASDEEETAKFMKYHFSKEVSDDVEIFTLVARIPDIILKRVDPTNAVLLEYMTTIDPTIETGKLLTKEGAGPLKKSRKSKKDVKVTPEKPITEPKKTKSPKQQPKPDDQVLKVLVQPIEPVSGEQSLVQFHQRQVFFED